MKLSLEKKNPRIELIPLIDIIFLLLVFFIYSMLSMVVYRGIPVSLPAADSVQIAKGEVLVITIDQQGTVFLNKRPVLPEGLSSHLKTVRAAFPNKAVVISGHRKANYETFVDVLDKVRLAGFNNISIEAIPAQRATSPQSGPKG